MKETIYNLYTFVKDGVVSEVGITPREYPERINTFQKEKTAEEFLSKHAEEDLSRAKIFGIPKNYIITDIFSPEEDLVTGIPYRYYKLLAKERNHEFSGLFENAYEGVRAPLNPFVYYSVVENDKIIEMHV